MTKQATHTNETNLYVAHATYSDAIDTDDNNEQTIVFATREEAIVWAHEMRGSVIAEHENEDFELNEQHMPAGEERAPFSSFIFHTDLIYFVVTVSELQLNRVY